MAPDFSEEERLAALDRIIENDRYPLSPRIRTLREIRAKLKPYPARGATTAEALRAAARRR